jgi:hypothetical protein
MSKGLLLLLIVSGFISAQPLDSQELPFAGIDHAQSFLRTIYRGLERFIPFWQSFGIPFLAEGGSDGGGSDGGGSDGGGSDGGGSDGGGSDGGGSDGGGSDGGGSDAGSGDGTGGGAGDATSADDAATAATGSVADDAAADDAQAPDSSDLDADPTSVTVAPTAPTDPTTEQNAVSPEIAAIEAIATTDPRGGFVPFTIPGTDVSGLAPGSTIVSGTSGAPVDVAINAVIVSAGQSPWDAITKGLGVRNVIVTGGIIALGKTPIEGEVPGGGPQPAWLRLIPDLRLLNGSMIPPVVPNVIDIRILSSPIEILNPPQGG